MTASTIQNDAVDPANPAENPPAYDRPQRFFHWTMAAIILCALGLGLWASFLTPGTPFRRGLLELHKSLGFTAAALILPRIVYRLISRPPPADKSSGWLSHAAAHAAHLCLYALMLFMPVSGYMFSAAGGYSLPWFGLFQFPRLLDKVPAVSQAGQMLHNWGALVLYVVVAAHLAAVLFHQFVKRDGVLSRMLPTKRDRLTGSIG
jgi:cytochrome b561